MAGFATGRVQSFEFNDQVWVPAILRDTIVEALSRTLRWGKIIEGLADPFVKFLDECGCRSVLDIGSGAGEPAAILSETLRARGRDVDFLLTDLFPRPECWRPLCERSGGKLSFVETPVDATNLDRQLSAGRARVILNVLHHLPPQLAEAVIRDAIESGAPLFVAEGFSRNPLGFLPFAPVGLCALASAPLLAKDRRLARALLTWLSPVGLLASTWDGLISTMRVYTEAELREMAKRARGADGYNIEFGTYRFPFGGRGTYFSCVPRSTW